MEKAEIEEILIQVVSRIQEMSGRQPSTLSGSTKPISDLEGFDSLNGVEATIDACEQLGFDPGFNNIFVSDTGSASLSIEKAASRLALCVAGMRTKEGSN